MRKVIEGLVYDTSTAEKVHRWRNGGDTGNFHYCSETLYRTKAGRWFLYGEGGAASSWAESFDCGRSTGWGEDIRPMLPEEAQQWMEAHDCLAETIEKHFKLEEA